MTQGERRLYLIKELLAEHSKYANVEIPISEEEQKRLLRSLFNIRFPQNANDKFLSVQNEYLQEEIRQKGITDLASLKPLVGSLYLWQGDITTLKCDAIVNAANSGMTGCYQPCHACIDNCIHTFAGIQLRLECAELMYQQGFEEPTGTAKITSAYNMPCHYVIHTVGPIVRGTVTKKDCDLLQSCYRSCLELAEKSNVRSIAFCCISTGVFHFPNKKAAEIAVATVKEYLEERKSEMKVIFNVFKDEDYKIYRALLGQYP